MRDWKSFVAQERTLFFLSWLYRYGVAIGVIAYYRQLQEGDILAYFHDLALWREYLLTGAVKWQDLWNPTQLPQNMQAGFWLHTQPRAHAFVLCLLPLWLLCGGAEWLFVAVVTAAGNALLWYFFRSIRRYFPSLGPPAFIALFLLPSMAIWTTPPLKESMVIPAVYYVYACLLHYCHHKRLSALQWLGTGLVFLLLWKTKYYYFAALLPFCFMWMLFCRTSWLRGLSVFKAAFAGIAAAAVFLWLLPRVHPNLSPAFLLEALWQNHRDIVRLSNPQNVYFLPFDGSAASFVLSIPLAVVNGLFRPFLWDATLPVALILGPECLLPVVSLLFLVKQKRFPTLSVHQWLLLGFIVANAAFLGVAAPNVGALTRYRLIYWVPWWLLAASVVIKPCRLTNKL